MNRFTRRSDGPRQIVTLLTGKLTFRDAQSLAAAIHDGKAAPLEWVDESGNSVAKQFGDLKIVRPMAVACDANTSGVIMIAVFPSARAPEKKMIVKFDPKSAVTFDEQAQ